MSVVLVCCFGARVRASLADLLRGEVRHGYDVRNMPVFFKGTGAVLGCNSAEIDVSRQAGSTFESITRWVPAGRGDHVQIAAFLAKPARYTFKKVFYWRNLG